MMHKVATRSRHLLTIFFLVDLCVASRRHPSPASGVDECSVFHLEGYLEENPGNADKTCIELHNLLLKNDVTRMADPAAAIILDECYCQMHLWNTDRIKANELKEEQELAAKASASPSAKAKAKSNLRRRNGDSNNIAKRNNKGPEKVARSLADGEPPLSPQAFPGKISLGGDSGLPQEDELSDTKHSLPSPSGSSSWKDAEVANPGNTPQKLDALRDERQQRWKNMESTDKPDDLDEVSSVFMSTDKTKPAVDGVIDDAVGMPNARDASDSGAIKSSLDGVQMAKDAKAPPKPAKPDVGSDSYEIAKKVKSPISTFSNLLSGSRPPKASGPIPGWDDPKPPTPLKKEQDHTKYPSASELLKYRAASLLTGIAEDAQGTKASKKILPANDDDIYYVTDLVSSVNHGRRKDAAVTSGIYSGGLSNGELSDVIRERKERTGQKINYNLKAAAGPGIKEVTPPSAIAKKPIFWRGQDRKDMEIQVKEWEKEQRVKAFGERKRIVEEVREWVRLQDETWMNDEA